MVEDVSRALCSAAGRSVYDAVNREPNAICSQCERQSDGSLVCQLWTSFRSEARVAIQVAYEWHKRERRWPEFVKK